MGRVYSEKFNQRAKAAKAMNVTIEIDSLREFSY